MKARSSTLETRAASVLTRLGRSAGITHAALALRSGDGAIEWSGAIGAAGADGEPMTAETPYFIASIDKLYTAVLVLRLAEERLITLDQPIAELLPETIWRGIHVRDGVDHSARITVRNLATHTSGLSDYLEEAPPGGRSLIEELVEDGDRTVSTAEALELVRSELVPHFPPQDPRDPRARARYSDTNYLLLIELIERVRSAPYAEVLHQELFAPLGLQRTYVMGSAHAGAGTAPRPAALFDGSRVLEVGAALASLRSIVSTLADQIASLVGIVTGSVFHDPATRTTMMTGFHRFGIPRDRSAARAPSWPIEYGFGMMRLRLPRWMTPLGRIPEVVGHTGSTGTWLFWCPEHDLYIAGTVDEVNSGAVPFRFVPRLLHELRGTEALAGGPPRARARYNRDD